MHEVRSFLSNHVFYEVAQFDVRTAEGKTGCGVLGTSIRTRLHPGMYNGGP